VLLFQVLPHQNLVDLPYSINPDPTKLREPCAILGQPFQRSPAFWLQARSYTTGELSIYGTNSSGAPFDAR